MTLRIRRTGYSRVDRRWAWHGKKDNPNLLSLRWKGRSVRAVGRLVPAWLRYTRATRRVEATAIRTICEINRSSRSRDIVIKPFNGAVPTAT